MKELTKYFLPFIKVLIIPYIFIMFVLVWPIEFYISSPGGIAEVENLIEIEYNLDKEIEGSISTTYIMYIKRPTFFEFIIGNFSPYTNIGNLTTTYTNSESNQIAFLDKETSVNAAIIVAYEKASDIKTDIVIDYYQRVLVFGKADYLDHYDEIEFGDDFVKIIGDDSQEITDVLEIAANTVNQNEYEWFFLDESGDEYSLIISKDNEYGLFGITLKTYYFVDQETTFPRYSERNSNIGGPSGGLLQTLSIYNMLVDEDLTHGLKIAGTGTIHYDGTIGYIGGVEQKIVTAHINKVDLFFMPNLDDSYALDNYLVALQACEKYNIDSEGWLIPVANLQDAIDYLEGLS
ncbi:MAG: hypothetical protein KAH13_02455 [Tenericutes bacterium]|nr:hypothetical protein [Mycoplasmatota bacterium]